ncbi:MAG: ImmA/IrrE family metallo-endopeptidase [Gammaproteobacteria bacterium]|nr:ImmA/IrrE family metallo-endopeptidase [Gammaproteobacteria bacterium]MYE49769.1 ImmA/IrrE family metallo-endopeptidase [Gammaproteobacteria bacterium]
MRRPRKAQTLRPIVNDLLRACDVSEVPVPVEVIAEHLGARVAYARYKGELAGVLMRRDNGPAVIGVNSAHHINRQRFTIAHECGHLCLHKGKDVYVDRSFRMSVSNRDKRSAQAIDPEEIEANRFAAELLMPLDRLLDDISEFDIEDDKALKELADRYAVSVQALTHRINNLLENVM